VQGGTNSSEFRIPDPELADTVELRVPEPDGPRLNLVPSDKILFPRRMLYVEAVLYAAVAVLFFLLGYSAGRGKVPPKEDSLNNEAAERVPVEGKVLLDPRGGTKHGDEGAVVIFLPAGKPPENPLPIAGLRPSDPPAADGAGLAKLGGVTARADAKGNFSLVVPAAGSFRILIISRQATRMPNVALEQGDMTELARYFVTPAELLQRSSYHWLTRDIVRGAKPIEVVFTE
jgi:hypothetical protein